MCIVYRDGLLKYSLLNSFSYTSFLTMDYYTSSTGEKNIELYNFFPVKDHQQDSHELIVCSSSDDDDDDDDEGGNDDVTVALSIGPPCSSSRSKDHNEKGAPIDEESGSGMQNSRFWIPTRSQILVGFTNFSCQICNKTFNRYNNLQVGGSM